MILIAIFVSFHKLLTWQRLKIFFYRNTWVSQHLQAFVRCASCAFHMKPYQIVLIMQRIFRRAQRKILVRSEEWDEASPHLWNINCIYFIKGTLHFIKLFFLHFTLNKVTFFLHEGVWSSFAQIFEYHLVILLYLQTPTMAGQNDFHRRASTRRPVPNPKYDIYDTGTGEFTNLNTMSRFHGLVYFYYCFCVVNISWLVCISC